MRRTALIERRKLLGFSQMSLAHAIPCDRGTVVRWEAGETVSPGHRQPLADAMQLSLVELDALLNGSQKVNLSGGWWSNFETLEQSATSARSWEPVLIPGLLQTRDYATAILGNEDLVTRRMQRQAIVPRISLQVVIDESTSLRPVGGRYVLANQLRHLVAMNERDNVSVRVLPLDSSRYPGDWGAFLVLGFSWPGGLVYLQHDNGSHSLDSPHDVDNHRKLFEKLQELALSESDSNELMAERSKQHVVEKE